MCKNLSPAVLAILDREQAILDRREAILSRIAELESDVCEMESERFEADCTLARVCMDSRRPGCGVAGRYISEEEETSRDKKIKAEYAAVIAPMKRQIRRLQIEWIWSF